MVSLISGVYVAKKEPLMTGIIDQAESEHDESPAIRAGPPRAGQIPGAGLIGPGAANRSSLCRPTRFSAADTTSHPATRDDRRRLNYWAPVTINAKDRRDSRPPIAPYDRLIHVVPDLVVGYAGRDRGAARQSVAIVDTGSTIGG